MKTNVSKFIGSTMIVIGTAIGAGMLALPMVSAKAGFPLTILLTVGLWLLMTITGLLVLELSLKFPLYQNNFATIAKATLGKTGSVVTWISGLILLYALTSAYIAGNTSLLGTLIQTYAKVNIPSWINAVVFTFVLGGIVFWSTRAVDCLNRFLLGAKGIFLFITLFLLLPHVKISLLLTSHHEFKYIFLSAPIFACSFGYHTIVPSLINYNGKNLKLLKKIIFCGTTTTLLVYSLWLLVTMGIVPLDGSLNSFSTVIAHHDDVGEFVSIISQIVKQPLINIGIDTFANIAMTTSFLGVGLSLFDFLADGCKRKNNVTGRLQTAFLTFIPPLIFAIFYPQGFILALGYASIFVAILTIIFPALMTYVSRKNARKHIQQSIDTIHIKSNSEYKVKINNFTLLSICLIGLTFIVLQIIAVFLE